MEQNNRIYGIGIVGCGNISKTHADAILETTAGKLVAAHSRTQATLQAFCESYNITAFDSYEEFLDNPDLDIVVICTPTGTHLDYGKKAAEAGKHVIVEKPIEVTVKRGRTLIQSCKENDVKLAVIYQSRFIQDIIEMKQTLDAGEIGKIIFASASVKWFRDQAYYKDSSWRGTFALDGGGAVVNQSIHTIDLLLWFIGNVKCISAFKGTFTHEGIEAEDSAVACLEFKNDVIGVFEASTSIDPPQERKIEVNGSQGTLQLKGDTFIKKIASKSEDEQINGSDNATGAASPLAGMTQQHHMAQYEQILNAFSSNAKPIVSGEESLQSLAIVEALYKSANNKELIYIDEILQQGEK